VLAAITVLAVIGAGGYVVVSRAYYVGADGGRVVIYQGFPQEVGGYDLSWIAEDGRTDVPVEGLPEFRQADLREGIAAGSLSEARRIVGGLRGDLAESTEEPTGSDPSGSPPSGEDSDRASPAAPDPAPGGG